jgi:hypothetical protein
MRKSAKLTLFCALAVGSVVDARDASAYEERDGNTVGALVVTYRGTTTTDFVSATGGPDPAGYLVANRAGAVDPYCTSTISYASFGDPTTTRGSLDVAISFSRMSSLTTQFGYDNNALFFVKVEANGQVQNWYTFMQRYLFKQRDFGGGTFLTGLADYELRLPQVPFSGELKDVKVSVCALAPRSSFVIRDVVLDLRDYVP